MFAEHQIVIANGAETQSLFPGPQMLKTVGKAAQDEIFALFPKLFDGAIHAPAREFLTGRMARKLTGRHHTRDGSLVM